MKIIANIADNYGLHCSNKQYSKIGQFNYNEDKVNDYNRNFNLVYKKPNIPKIYYEKETINKENYEKGKIKFLSEIDNERINREAVFHYWENIKSESNINIILIHGWTANRLNRLEKVFENSFIERGYNIYSYVLPFHMERSPSNSLYSGEFFVSADVIRTIKSVQQSVSDIRALINYIKTVKKQKIMIISLSLGGLVSNLLAETEKNIDVLISIFYANDLAFSVFETEIGKNIKKDFVKNNFSYNSLKESWEITNPSLRKPIIPIDNILLISGKHDKYISLKDADLLWNKWGKPTRYTYNCGHSGIVLNKKKIRNDVLKFIEERI